MALPMLVNGADCGPINPLQSLGKRFDQDRGAQQDHFGVGRAGSSRESFRTQSAAAPGFVQDASRFFNAHQPNPAQMSGIPAFDLSALQKSLPASQAMSPTARQAPAGASSWAADFMQQQQPLVTSPVTANPHSEMHGAFAQQISSPAPDTQGNMRAWSPPAVGMRMNTMPTFSTNFTPQNQNHGAQSSSISWDKEFQSLEQSLVAQPLPEQSMQQPSTQARPDDDLARTAALLIDAVRHEENPKFKSSQFMSLMRQLRDGEMTVDGNEMVATSDVSRTAFATDGMHEQPLSAARTHNMPMNQSLGMMQVGDVKGKGRETGVADGGQTSFADYAREFLAQQDGTEASTATREAEDANDAYFRQENADYTAYWDAMDRSATGKAAEAPEGRTRAATAQNAEWDRLQTDWDRFEATATGISQVANYQFQEHNPYLLGEASRTRHHTLHSGGRHAFLESVLEMEAAVQREPHKAEAWFALGVKQQENEREQEAIQALLRALELAPEHRPARLALAVSHTNEGHRLAAYDAIRAWAEGSEQYAAAVAAHRAANPERADWSQAERFGDMIRCLVGIAAAAPPGQDLDADVQIALAVLLNINEEWEKSGDCFRTALAVRPDDWLLWNRVGATLANSGHADEALQYYSHALELNPVYIRARYNIGIALINLRRYGEAAEHLLDALVLQDSDSTQNADSLQDKRAITSSSLWDSLKTACIHMQRLDLSTMCERRDLNAFREAYEGSAV